MMNELPHYHHPDNSLLSSTPQVTVLIENPRKSTNWGPLLRCCAAFGIAQIFVIGYDTCSVQGSHGASKYVELVAFHSMEAAVITLRELGFTLLGLLQGIPEAWTPQPVHKVVLANGMEMVQVQSLSSQAKVDNQSSSTESTGTTSEFPFSVPLHQRPFAQHTCLVVGKRASGLPLGLAHICDSLVHIPTFGSLAGTTTCSSWLTMEASVSIVLHEFALWAGYGTHNNSYQGQKYHVQPKQRGNPNQQSEKQEQRKAQRELDSIMDESQLGNLFDPDPNGDY